MAWFDDMIREIARAGAIDVEQLELSPEVRREILDLARISSHTSGERINAPLLCYALGLAVGGGASLEDLAAAVRTAAGESSG